MSNLTTQPARASGEFAIGGELPVVRLGYGSMQIPGPGVWGEPRDRDEVIRVLRRALELGVTFIDTADSYALGVSERLIREALHPYQDGLVVSDGHRPPGQTRWTAATHCREARRDTCAARVAAAALTVLLPIPGTSTVAHLEENLAAALIELTPDRVRQLEAQ